MATAASGIRISALVAATLALVLVPSLTANADTTIDGPIDLGTADTYSVFATDTITNTNLSVLNGDLGLSPGTSVTGFPPGIVNGTSNVTNGPAAQARIDIANAYGIAASLTPRTTGVGDLVGLSLVPGVYSGGALSLTGALELAGNADSVWVFQAASTLTIGSDAIITMSGGATSCNVFWQVGSSASLDGGADFTGTILAAETITAVSEASIAGRLFAQNGAVTLDQNLITSPTLCGPTGVVSTSPTITSSTPPSAQAGTPYSYTITASGSPSSTYTVTSGALPTGLTLDSTTGALAGTPTTAGTYTFTVTAANGTGPDATASYTIEVAAAAVVAAAAPAPTLAASGADAGAAAILAATLLLLGTGFALMARRRAAQRVG